MSADILSALPIARQCFLIAPIGEEGSPTRARTDAFQTKVLEPAIAGLDIQIVRADQISESALITKQIVGALVSSDVAVADLTGHNPNVFYELGIRHAMRKPVIHVRLKGTPLPFDNSHMRTIDYDLDEAAVAASISAIRSAIVASIDRPANNPFAAATDSFVVLRNQLSILDYRSLDVLDGLEALVGHFRHLLSLAGPGTEYWVQTVGASAMPEDIETLLRSAVDSGAFIRLIVNDNPPHSDRLLNAVDRIAMPDVLRAVKTTDSSVRVFGMGASHLVVAIRIDGRFNGIVIRDYDLVRFFHQWFAKRFNEIEARR